MNESPQSHPLLQGISGLVVIFLHDTLADMVPWVIAASAVIACDLVFGLRKAYLMHEEIRFSQACRNTMVKTVAYFAFVCTVCAVDRAAGGEYGIDKWSCLTVCFVEGCSVFANILKPKGIELDITNLLNALFRKAAGVGGDARVFTETGDNKKTNKQDKGSHEDSMEQDHPDEGIQGG